MLCLQAGGPVLDIGCGAGYLGQLLTELGVEVTLGADSSRKAIEKARASKPGLRWLVAHRAQLKRVLEHMRYQTIALVEVLEHVPDDMHMLGLIPSGRNVVLSVPSSRSVGHVRWFVSMQDVRDRYSHVLRVHKAHTVTCGDNRWFIAKGTTR